MKFLFLVLLAVLSFGCFASDFSIDTALDWFNKSFSWGSIVLSVLGGLTVIGTIIDKIVPDKYDGGFMSKIYNKPIIGLFLKSFVRFSPLCADVEQDKK